MVQNSCCIIDSKFCLCYCIFYITSLVSCVKELFSFINSYLKKWYYWLQITSTLISYDYLMFYGCCYIGSYLGFFPGFLNTNCPCRWGVVFYSNYWFVWTNTSYWWSWHTTFFTISYLIVKKPSTCRLLVVSPFTTADFG